mgnify:CR=1 FL=1
MNNDCPSLQITTELPPHIKRADNFVYKFPSNIGLQFYRNWLRDIAWKVAAVLLFELLVVSLPSSEHDIAHSELWWTNTKEFYSLGKLGCTFVTNVTVLSYT